MNELFENSPLLDIPAERTSKEIKSPFLNGVQIYTPFRNFDNEIINELEKSYIRETLNENEAGINEVLKNNNPVLIQPETELSEEQLDKAVELNEKNKRPVEEGGLGWGGFIPQILSLIEVKDSIKFNHALIYPEKFARALAEWQDKKRIKTNYKGTLGLNIWTYFQKKLGLHNLSNKYKINVEKAIRNNKYYESRLWGDLKKSINKYLSSIKILPVFPVNDEYFAYAVADFQALKGLSKDGILGPDTLSEIKKLLSSDLSGQSAVRSKWHNVIPGAVQCPAEFLVDGKDTFASMVSALRKAGKGDYICILGWMLDISFPLVPNDPGSTLYNLLLEADIKGAFIRILIWQNPYETDRLNNAKSMINKLNNAIMLTDNATFGSPLVAFFSSQVKSAMNSVPFPLSTVLDTISKWREIKNFVSQPNEGSHHEKILIIKNGENLVAFCGGVDINPNRLTTHYDVHCMVEGHAAWELLQRFKQRWEVYSVRSNPGALGTLPALITGQPGSISGAGNPYVKIFHTYNHPDGKLKDRSIHDTLKKVIAKAEKSVYMEDQYMVSCEIAGWLNEKLRKDSNFKVKIVTQADEFAKEDMEIPKRKRDEFIRKLEYKILNPANLEIKFLDKTKSPPLTNVHSKIYIVDDKEDGLVFIGSSNCNRRSMTNDSETGAFIFNDNNAGNFVKKFKEKVIINHPETNNDDYRNPRLRDTVKDLDEELIDQIDSIPLAVQIAAGPLISSAAKSAAKAAVKSIIGPLWEVIDPNPDNIKCDVPGITDSGINMLSELNDIEISSYTPFKDQDIASGNINSGSAEASEDETSSAAVKTCEGLYCWAKTVLNKQLGINLPVNNFLDEAAGKAIGEFQAKNNLEQTKKIDPATERKMLECDAVQKMKGTADESEAVNIINSAKTKIEDWTKQAVVVKKEITNSYRDPRKLWAFVLHHMAFKRRNRAGQLSDPDSYLKTGAHFCIMMDGRIIQLHQFSRMIWHGNCLSPRSVAVEFEGNFPNIKGRWWIDKDSSFQNKDIPTQAQYDSGRFLARYLKIILGTTSIFAHRQSSEDRENDPGPDIWYNVGQWAIDNLGMTDGGPAFKCGTGNPILPEWRTWDNKTSLLLKKESELNDVETMEQEYELMNEGSGCYESGSETETEDETKLTEALEFNDNTAYEHYQDELSEPEIDLLKAVKLNRYYAEKLGWNKFYDLINDLLLPFSGQSNVSLGEEAFAQAVASWQKKLGFSEKDSDGIIGPKTWTKMQAKLNLSSSTVPAYGINSETVSKIEKFSNAIEGLSRQYGLNPNITRGIIAAESGGNYLSGQGRSGYKGLMQADTSADQLKPEISLKTGIEKFIKFRDNTLNPWLKKLGISILSGNNENYLKACLSCYNAGPVTALKAIQYANANGNWQQWLSPVNYKRALLFSGGYAYYSGCSKGISKIELDEAKSERLKYRFKTSGWRTESDPPEWNIISPSLNPVMRCWIETKYQNTPGYLDRFINYYKYFENNSAANINNEEPGYYEGESNQEYGDETEYSEIFEINDKPEYQHYSGESNESEIDLSKAVKLNRYYADKLGWNKFYDQINDLLLPYSGLQNVSLGEEAFAQAAAAWQKQRGFPEKDCDGIIGPNTWNRMKSFINSDIYKPADITVSSAVPSIENIPAFNAWYAQKIIDAMKEGIAGSNFNAKDQLESIAKCESVLNADPNKRIIQILPVIYHIVENAKSENYRDIIIGSFIRKADDNGSCSGHCEGRCIDLNFKGGSFENPDSTKMVIKILQYLNSLPSQFKKNLGFGMPLQGDFFGHQNFKKFKSVDSSNLINAGLRNLVFRLGIVFPDNNNHLHIQVRWDTATKINHEDLAAGLGSENEIVQYSEQENLFNNLFDNYTLAYRLDKVRDWLPLLLFKVDDNLVANLKSRDMYVQYAHNESYSNDLNTDFYRLRIHKYPVLNGIQMDAQSLIKYIRININSLIDTDLCDFYPYDPAIDTPVWQSDEPKGAVLKLDIKGPDNASVAVSLAKPNGWRFTTVHTPATGAHPVSGNREFFIAKDSATGGTYFVIKGLDMMSTGIAGLGLPFFGGWGFKQADALWKSMRNKIINLINSNGGEAGEDITYSERIEWRFVYYSYKNLLEATFGKGAGSPENSPFFDVSEVPGMEITSY